MDILTHTLSGVAIGTVIANFSSRDFWHKLKIIALAGFAGSLPDIDAISLWSGFDSTIGKFFNLSYSGKQIYSAKLWYSHHGFMHSVFAGFLIAGLISLIAFLTSFKLKNLSLSNFIQTIKRQKFVLIGFLLAFIFHLIADMPTPSSAWGGVNLFWPSNSYIGGSGDIWWWNNYDIFLIVLSVLIINFTLLIAKRFLRFNLQKLSTIVFLLGFILSLYQIKARNYNFEYSGHSNRYQEFELKSKEIQKEILGKKAYKFMVSFDNKLKIHF